MAYSTFIGNTGHESGWGIAVDQTGNAYIAGVTDGRNSTFPNDGFPTTPGAFKMFGSVDAFVTKLNPAGSALVYSTLLGGTSSGCAEERARDIDVDGQGNAYVVGMTTCDDFPVANAFQSAPTNFREEAFLTKFNSTGTALAYSTYLGGPRYDEATHVAVDGNGTAVVSGTTSGDFQLITPGAYDTTWNGANGEHPDDIFVIKVSDRLTKSRFDFDGDGKADVSVFRPDNGVWYLQNSSSGFSAAQFGLSTDKLVPADYDGDGKTDIAVYRGGIWYLQRSTAGFTGIAFGAADDVPVPADFNGDGKAELAVFRPSNGVWYFYDLATNQTSGVQFGQAGDKPVAADYDGDGKADVAVFRSGIWYLQRSTLGFAAVQFGEATDKPAAADYDGDGKADVAVFRPSNGVWYLQRSQAGFTGIQFGFGTDVPVPADYDGDGKTDVAVFRNGIWYLQRSTAGFTGIQFGAASDRPVPDAFVP